MGRTAEGALPVYPRFMCGRYLRRSDKQRIDEAFRVGKLPDDFVPTPDYNVAPTTFQPVIRESRNRLNGS